ncbi:proline dehydrogenase family protein [Haloechinothrix sp. LS1_15]|uniref:proline dehydrogenase family protein n=1 Tax=Haloechinothrix sp. LS1_15 TaxID=2652248 RepID=UPI0029489E45|nr:proline dehydrogenase family protein [Haloechinothrix sp. LS1_15]MDV6013751.1 proline dehydrogenase [Haloechinothrix sp. LS1_15]
MLRSSLLAASRSATLRRFVEHNPLAAAVVARFVAGTEPTDALGVAGELAGQGLTVSLDRLGESVTDTGEVRETVTAYRELLAALADTGLAGNVEISVKLSALGLCLPGRPRQEHGGIADGERIALDAARQICRAAPSAGTTVTVDMEDHTTVDATLRTLRELRADFPWVGGVLQAYLRRTETDCAELATAGSRVRLCKGAYREPDSVAFGRKTDVDLSYIRCLKTLMSSKAYPMIATHDPRLIAIAEALAVEHGRAPSEYEFQMLHGVRPEEHRRLAESGHTVRVYVPYGRDWYPYFMRRLAERPANVGFFLRSLVTRS